MDAVAVHAGAGCWGLLAAPFFVQVDVDVDVDVDDDNVGWHPYLRVSKRAGGRAHDYSDSRFIDTSLIRPKKRLLEPNKQDNI